METIIGRWPLFLSLLLALLAVLIPYWPLAPLSILIVGAAGEWFTTLLLGMFFDVLYGRPPGGWLHLLAFPMTALALGAVILRRVFARYLRRDDPQYL